MSTDNAKVLWDRINEILGNKSSGSCKQSSLVVNGVELKEAKSVADAFNVFFTSVGDNVASSLSSDGDINKFRTMEFADSSLFLRPTHPAEVLSMITSLDATKATGFDEFPVSSLKKNSLMLSKLLSTCFNESVSSVSRF